MAFIVDCKSKNSLYWNRDEITVAYFNDIKNYPLLTQEQERELLTVIKTEKGKRADDALKRLIECNQRFIVSVARKSSNNYNLLDIVNEGNLGLYKALENYDLSKKERFITYAIYWVRKYINNYLITKERSVVPNNAHKLYTYLHKINNEFYSVQHRYPTTEELQSILLDRYNINITNTEDLLPCVVSSIDEEITNSKGQDYKVEEVSDFSVATSNNNVNEYLDNIDNKKIVEYLLSYLKDRDREIIVNYYGIDCEALSIDKIANNLSLTKERVRQIINNALSFLKEKLINTKKI